MFDKTYEDRLRAWHEFRNRLETIDDPIQHTIEHYQQAPFVSMHTDPWTQEMWPNPWELVQENQYCDFCKFIVQNSMFLIPSSCHHTNCN